MLKRRYYIMPHPGIPGAIVYGAFSPQSAACYAEAQGITCLEGSYRAETVAVREAQEKYGKVMRARQLLVH